METKIKILAHRGGLDRAPENTITSFKQAFEDGADAFECDVRLTKDREPIIIHTGFNEDSIQEVTGSTSPLSELNWVDVQKLKVLDSSEPVAHLDEVLSFVKESGLPCFIEPKEEAKNLIPLLVERIQQFDLVNRVGILTFYSRKELLVQVKQIEPEIQTTAIIINPMANLLKKAEAIDVNRIAIGWNKINHFRIYNAITHSLIRKVRRLKSKGIAVEGGFVQTRRDVEWLLRHEIGGLWVDDVPKIRGFAGV